MAEPTMTGKTCLVTGGTSGIGAATAEGLARLGARVLVVGRNAERGEDVTRAIRERTGNPAVEFRQADLSSQAEIRRLAGSLQDELARLDVLVNNAGAIVTQRRLTVDGIELTFALNHLAYFLLTNLLIDLLKASAPARIVSVSSDAHRWAKRFDFEALADARRRHDGLGAYAQSKLANLLFTGELARRLEGTGVTANALHPGFVATNIFAVEGWLSGLMQLGAKLFAIRPEDGAKTSIYLASAPAVEGISGRYFVKERESTPTIAARDEAAARRLWTLSEELTGLASASASTSILP